MAQVTYLNGQVLHQSLPVMTHGLDPDAPARKRLHLPQGDLAQLHNGPEPIHYLAWIELKAGGVRGNHVHRVKREYLYLLAGSARLLVEDLANHERATVELVTGDLVLIEPGIAHAIGSPTPGQALEFSPSVFDPTDTVRHLLTEA